MSRVKHNLGLLEAGKYWDFHKVKPKYVCMYHWSFMYSLTAPPPHCPTPHCPTPHCPTPHCPTPHCPTPHCPTPHCPTPSLPHPSLPHPLTAPPPHCPPLTAPPPHTRVDDTAGRYDALKARLSQLSDNARQTGAVQERLSDLHKRFQEVVKWKAGEVRTTPQYTSKAFSLTNSISCGICI